MTPQTPPHAAADGAAARPRVEGDREQEIFDATLSVLADVGYDRLTMDAVATASKASKATLYRRWNSKVHLVTEALAAQKAQPEAPDTGTLRGDLIASFCGLGGMTDPQQMATFSSVLTAMVRDPEFAAAYRRDVLGPKIATTAAIYRRAAERGELCPDVDLEVVAPALAGILLHRFFVLGESPDEEAIARVIDHVILPAATRPADPTAHPSTPKDLS
ncbi:TetR/AcrR family transcriptional regulator [Nocardioides sp. InS609-2]|uniref:TetR/AcrR family transcriptional regulator n=1 Tax=Nocardioides sp. InS609-2 TaxID=2760705 RepID=UPI0020BEE86E|nr:TetR/AcrR family transcriptional regulator [Nocardioides sp. InS609-2]